MRISTFAKISLPVAILIMTGQSCSIPFMTTSSSQSTTDGGVFRSDNHGQTWKQKSAGDKQNPKGVQNISIRTLVQDSRDPARLMIGTLENGIWLTSNAGETWKPTSLTTGEVNCISVNPADPDIQYASRGGTVQKSIDNGLNWKSVYADGQRQSVTCVLADRLRTDTVWATTSGGKLLRSDDAGKSWAIALKVSKLFPRKIVQEDQVQDHLYVFTRTSGIIDIDIAASNWQDLSGALKKYPGATTINGVSVTFGAPTVWTIATNYGLLQSFDRGSTWSTVSTLVTPGTAAIQNVAVNPRDQQELFVTIGNKLHHSRDRGATWTVLSIPTTRTPVALQYDSANIDRLFVGTFLVTK